MSRRASRPLNRRAVSSADDELYRRHQDDERPNPLFDEDGNLQQLDPDDPAQAELRREWTDLYIEHGGQVEEDAGKPS